MGLHAFSELIYSFSSNTNFVCSAHGRLAAFAISFTVTDGNSRQIKRRSRTSGDRYAKRMIRLTKRSEMFSALAMSLIVAASPLSNRRRHAHARPTARRMCGSCDRAWKPGSASGGRIFFAAAKSWEHCDRVGIYHATQLLLHPNSDHPAPGICTKNRRLDR